MSRVNIQKFAHIVGSNKVCDSIFRYALIHVILMLFHSCIVLIRRKIRISHLQQIQKKETHTSLQFTQNNTKLPTSPNSATLTSNVYARKCLNWNHTYIHILKAQNNIHPTNIRSYYWCISSTYIIVNFGFYPQSHGHGFPLLNNAPSLFTHQSRLLIFQDVTRFLGHAKSCSESTCGLGIFQHDLPWSTTMFSNLNYT